MQLRSIFIYIKFIVSLLRLAHGASSDSRPTASLSFGALLFLTVLVSFVIHAFLLVLLPKTIRDFRNEHLHLIKALIKFGCLLL